MRLPVHAPALTLKLTWLACLGWCAVTSAATLTVSEAVAGTATSADVTATVPAEMAKAQAGVGALSTAARDVAGWAVASHDHLGRPFVIVDKARARVIVFGADGRPQASTPVLLGAAKGDDSVPGIGQRKIADILPKERTTPAGRFVGEPGRNAQGEDIVWVDYDAAVSMHRVRATNPQERRLERLASPGIGDNRISYGCINVPAAFYDQYIHPVFARGKGIVYVLPETRPARDVFGIGKTGQAVRPAGAPGHRDKSAS